MIELDLKAIVYGVISSVIFAILARWTGVWHRIREQIARRAAVRRLRRELLDTISSATVVGRRQGFDIAQVYVTLDLAVSDLMSDPDSTRRRLPVACVLVGGPGAGKSTYVKRRLMTHMESHEFGFFLRLRDYSGEESVEAAFINQLTRGGLPKADVEFATQMLSAGTLVVLDGLDEIRPAYRENVFQRINQFYREYFGGYWDRSQLIVTCRKEAYRTIPLDIPHIWEVRPLADEQIKRFAELWPLGYPAGKSFQAFCADLQATPKILELARSPLLLVGGLMQYSESNLGIPEERFQYLARIGRWLIADWAAAQGLPPDPQRPLYDRLLPRLAIEMHERAVAELPIEDATGLLADWLPQYGGTQSAAGAVLEGMLTRTGILVRDIPGMIVFAQFSLQEYFAAVALTKSGRLLDVIETGAMPWWREAILLAIAQMDNPASALISVFNRDAALGAEAVAECPTPPIVIQERAAAACVSEIDSRNPAATRATVALLRKVAAGPEQKLIGALEERLYGKGEIASTVGLILAHAGTPPATKLLAAHPEVWAHCLKTAGYLSSSFEDVLVDVIQNGSEAHAVTAAELLASRLSSDRRTQLINLLRELPASRATRVAAILIREVEISPPEDRDFSGTLREVAECAVRVGDLTALPDRREQPMRRYPPTLGEIAVVIVGVNSVRDPHSVAAILDGGLRWQHERRSVGAAFAAALAAMAATGPTERTLALFALASGILLAVNLLPEKRYPYGVIRHPLVRYRPPWPLSAVLAGAAIVFAVMSQSAVIFDKVTAANALIASLVFGLGISHTIAAYLGLETWQRLSPFRRIASVAFGLWYVMLPVGIILLHANVVFGNTILAVGGGAAAVCLAAVFVVLANKAHLFNEATEIAANAYVPAAETTVTSRALADPA